MKKAFTAKDAKSAKEEEKKPQRTQRAQRKSQREEVDFATDGAPMNTDKEEGYPQITQICADY